MTKKTREEVLLPELREAMETSIVEITDPAHKSDLCSRILSDLPQWFGLPEANRNYCQEVKQYRFIAIYHDDTEVGFASLKKNNAYVSELYVMGIFSKFHRMGFGSALLQFIVEDLKHEGFQYLEVKTLAESAESEHYQRTRQFYRNQGFIPLDVLSNEWGEDNPCLIMIKKL